MAIIQAFQVELALRQGDIERASDISKKVVFDMRPPLWFFYVPQLTPIKLLLAEGTDESLNEARTRLAELDEQMGRINRKNVRIDVLVLMALVCHELGDEETALKHLQSALDLAQPGGWIRNFVDLGVPMTALLERLIQLRPGHTYTKQVLDACRADASGKPTSDRVAEKTSSLSGQAAAPILSNREIDILHQLADGLSNKEIAFRLYISPDTVKTHLQNIYRKLDAKGGRVAALKTARMLGLIAPD
jgi:LuxR family maltose regulon positive regulatory protein